MIDRTEHKRKKRRNLTLISRLSALAALVAEVLLCLTLLAGGRTWAALLPLLYLAGHIATWRKMVRIDHGDQLNICLGETARNIMLFGALLTIGILLG